MNFVDILNGGGTNPVHLKSELSPPYQPRLTSSFFYFIFLKYNNKKFWFSWSEKIKSRYYGPNQ